MSLATLRWDALAAGFALAAACVAGEPQRGTGRVRPPDAVTCPRDQLTVYTDRVLTLERRPDATTVTIATDWNTTERAVVRHADAGSPEAWFLIKGQPFASNDWDAIAPGGKLRENARASAWVCRDGRNPIVDWERPSGSVARARYLP